MSMGVDADPQDRAMDLLIDALEHQRAGRLDDAERDYLGVLELTPGNPDALHLMGVLCYQRGDLDQALKLIRQALSRADGAASYWSNLGNVLRAQGDMAGAIDAYQTALQRQPDLADAANNLGSAYAQSGQSDLAMTTFEDLLERKPDHPEAHNNLGTLLKAAGDLEAAIAKFDRAIELEPNYVDALCNLGAALLVAGRPEDSQVAYSRAVDLEPGDADVRRDYGGVLMALDRLEEATEQFVSAKALAPGDFRCSLTLGNAYQKCGRLEEADAEYRVTLDLEPRSADALNNLGTLLRGRGEFERGLGLIDRALAIREEYPEAHFNRGTILVGLDRLEDAEQALLRARALAPDSWDVREAFVDLYVQMGELEKAGRSAKQWLADDPDGPIARHVAQSLGVGDETPTRCSEEYVRAEFDRAALEFDRHLTALAYKVPKYLESRLERLLEGTTKGGLSILDAGCGTGLCAESLRPWAQRLAGVDLSPRMLELAKARGLYDQLTCADLVEYLGNQNAEFDFVVLADVLIYFGDLTEVLQGVGRALKPGGRMFCSIERLGEGDDYRLRDTGRFTHRLGYVQRVLQETGFETETSDIAILRLERRLPVMGYLIEAGVR